MGLMQLMPDTARRYGVDNMMDPARTSKAARVTCATCWPLRRRSTWRRGVQRRAKRVIRFGRQIPPYAETKHYVPKVRPFYRLSSRARSPSGDAE